MTMPCPRRPFGSCAVPSAPFVTDAYPLRFVRYRHELDLQPETNMAPLFDKHATADIERSLDCVVLGWSISITATGCDFDTVKTSSKSTEKLFRHQENMDLT
jgi:hypothetical protein